ncbi:MAG: hypothetical protein WC455_10320 [Dehalococcoidia bacterium]|jgi:hypothetical protein
MKELEEKIKLLQRLKFNLERVNNQLMVISASRTKKVGSLRYDSYPELFKLVAKECTGSDFVERGDSYGYGIQDRALLVKLFDTVEPLLLTEKERLELEIKSMIN